jgi:hypothetical protein
MSSSGKVEIEKMLILTIEKLARCRKFNLKPEKIEKLSNQCFILSQLLNKKK